MKILDKLEKKLHAEKHEVFDNSKYDQFRMGKADPNVGPLVVFVNPKSGGNQGVKVLEDFKELLSPQQVFDLSKGGPKEGLLAFSKDGAFLPCRILACGGDGTPGWILCVMDELGFTNEPPIATLPLGTGNDISRVLGFGGGYKGQRLELVLDDLATAIPVPFDRWNCKVGSAEARRLNNYFSCGVDTDILLKFHEEREKNPEKFNNREKNKMHYIKYSLQEWKGEFSGRVDPLNKCCTVVADGKPLILPDEATGLMVLNIPSYGGGAEMWGSPKGFPPQSFSDGMLEIGYVKGTAHMAEIQSGLKHAVPLVQCRELKVAMTGDTACQIDGEPWLEKMGKSVGTVIEISHFKKNTVLHRPGQKIR